MKIKLSQLKKLIKEVSERAKYEAANELMNKYMGILHSYAKDAIINDNWDQFNKSISDLKSINIPTKDIAAIVDAVKDYSENGINFDKTQQNMLYRTIWHALTHNRENPGIAQLVSNSKPVKFKQTLEDVYDNYKYKFIDTVEKACEGKFAKRFNMYCLELQSMGLDTSKLVELVKDTSEEYPEYMADDPHGDYRYLSDDAVSEAENLLKSITGEDIVKYVKRVRN